MLFQPKTYSSSDQYMRHIDLCRTILKILLTASRVLEAEFLEETWTVLLKVVLGVTDYLLKDVNTPPILSLDSSATPASSTGIMNNADLGDALCDQLLRVLVELWLRSKTANSDLWRILRLCLAHWIQLRVDVAHHWCFISLALTLRLTRCCYGLQAAPDHIAINYPDITVNVPSLPFDFVTLAWHQLIFGIGTDDSCNHMVGDPNKLPPKQFCVFMGGVSRIIECLLLSNVACSTATLKSPLMIHPNTLCQMFSHWLVQAALKPVNEEFDEGRYDSLISTIHIMTCAPQDGLCLHLPIAL